MTFSEWLALWQPRDVIAAIAIVAGAVVTISLALIGTKQRRDELGLSLRRAAHLRFWSAASAWHRELDLIMKAEPETEYSMVTAMAETKREEQAYDGVWEVEIVSPAMYERCLLVVTTRTLGEQAMRGAVEAQFHNVDSKKQWESARAEIKHAAALLTKLRDEFRVNGSYAAPRRWWKFWRWSFA